MSSSHTRIITLALTVALLALPATPVLAAPAGGPGATATTPTDFSTLTNLWGDLVDRLGRFVDLIPSGGASGETPSAASAAIGDGADPDGTPSSEPTTSSSVLDPETSRLDGLTG